MKRVIGYAVVAVCAATLFVVGVAATTWNLHDYSNPPPARPYNGCTLIREADLPRYLNGEGDPQIVQIVQLAAQRIREEKLGMDKLHSYVTWAAAQQHVPISWEPQEGG